MEKNAEKFRIFKLFDLFKETFNFFSECSHSNVRQSIRNWTIFLINIADFSALKWKISTLKIHPVQ